MYIIMACLAAFLCLTWLMRKNYNPLFYFLLYSIVLGFLMVWYSENLFIFNYENRLLFWVALVLIAANGYIWERLPTNKLQFGILTILVFLAIGGQLRTLQTFEKRQANTIRLLNAANALPIEKMTLSACLQQTEKYINPTYLAFETALISALHHMPLKSIHFFSNDDQNLENKISDQYQNLRYFSFSEKFYTVLTEPLLPRKLMVDLICNTDSAAWWKEQSYYSSTEYPMLIFSGLHPQKKEVLSGQTATFTGKGVQYALNLFLSTIERNDSIEISVWRKGSDNGFLVVSDHKNPSKIWFTQQTVSEPNEKGWQKLSSTFIVTERTPLKTYVWNANYKNEVIFFDDFRVRIWRE
jgi:hypothetical protein